MSETKYCIRKADLESDKEEIISLWKRNMIYDPVQEDVYNWQYKQNPFNCTRCWVLIHIQTNQIIGSIGLVPRKVKIKEFTYLIGRTVGLAIDKNHRFLGTTIQLMKEALNEIYEGSFAYLYAIVPEHAIAVNRRTNFKSFGKMMVFARTISVSEKLKTSLPFLPDIYIKILTFLTDKTICSLSKDNWVRSSNYSIEKINLFDSRIDDLWKRTEKNITFATVRSSDFLQWRFTNKKPVVCNYICEALVNEGKIICGYIIYFTKNNIANIVDIFSEQNTMKIVLLKLICKKFRKSGIFCMNFMGTGSPAFIKTMRTFGFKIKSNWNIPKLELNISGKNTLKTDFDYHNLDDGFYGAVDDFYDHF